MFNFLSRKCSNHCSSRNLKNNLTVVNPTSKKESSLPNTVDNRRDIEPCEPRMLYERLDNQERKLEEIIDLIRST